MLDIAIAAMFLVYALHSASLIALPFIRPELYEKAQVKLNRGLVVVLGLVSVISMIYLTVVTLGRDIVQRRSLPPEHGGLAIWQLLLVWLAIGTVFYLVARWEGRRSGFDYEELLTRDLMED